MKTFLKFMVCWGVLRLTPVVAQTEDYQLGMGYQLHNGLTIGGYFSMEYGNGSGQEFVKIDDLAVLAYGSLGSNFSYLAELESVDFYVVDLENSTTYSKTTPAIERLYGDYTFSDQLSVRFGKFITPIGYWNLQPINVLRETTSNPRYSREMFPKFITGVDFYGYAPFSDSLNYHVFLQGSSDLDDEYININTDQHIGISLEQKLDSGAQIGGSIGTFRDLGGNRTNYLQFNTKWAIKEFRFQAEGMISSFRPQVGPSITVKSAYVQGEYSFTPQHAAITRLEYVDDERLPSHENIGILGYSYRPTFPVSLKVEYQWHSNSRNDLLLSSFSVLF